jgi:predicted nuclease with TOPRIM domain
MKNYIKATMLITLMFTLLILSMIAVANAGNWGYNDGRIIINVYPPIQAYPGDTIKIKVKVEALEDLRDVDIDIHVFGSKREGYDSWYRYLLVLSNRDLSSGVVRDENFTLSIPPDASPGLSYAIINIHYKYYSWFIWHDYYTDATFQMTYIYPGLLSERDYWKGQASYWKGQADYWENQYNSMKSDRDSWKNKYDSLYTNYLAVVQDRDYWKNQSDYWKSQYDKFVNEYNSLNATYNSLLANYTTLQSIYNSTAVEYATLQSTYKSLNSTYYSLKSEYDNLSSKHSALQSTYNSLKSEYDSLKSKYDALTTDLGTTRRLNYIFIITTIVFIATTTFFIVRRSKLKPKIETK